MKRFCALVTVVAALVGLCAQAQDDQYVRLFSLIQEADALYNNGRGAEALSKYAEAQKGLGAFQKGYPEWNAAVVKFRLDYVTGKIGEIQARTPGAAAIEKPTPQTANAAVPKAGAERELQQQIAALQNDIVQLRADRENLEAKLKEALSVRPANLDPAQLARQDERIKLLQKENDLLKVRLAQEAAKPARTAPPAETPAIEVELKRKVAEQQDRIAALELEKKALQNRLDTLIPSGWNAARIEETRKALADTTRQLAEQKEVTARLSKENEALLAQVKHLTLQTNAIAALRKENQELQAQVKSLKAGGLALPEDKPRQLAEAEAHVAALQSDKELLRLEKIALENRLKVLQSTNTPTVGSLPPAPPTREEARRIARLERERDDLLRKLETANKQLASRKSKGRVKELETEVASLRSRLDILEAAPVPFTAEELALFKQPEASPTEASAGRRSVRALPAGSASLVAEANRYFGRKEFDKAEAKYVEVLARNQKNPVLLANLAAVQLEAGRLDDAEKSIAQAIAQAPEDAFNYNLLGQLRLRQKRYDDALEVLSRGAKLDPENAEIQNYLGLALSEKGMRKPAEAALRKAIQLKPNYAVAHNNLAVIYLSQQPPLTELARWHYQRALAAGADKNSKLEQMLEARSGSAR